MHDDSHVLLMLSRLLKCSMLHTTSHNGARLRAHLYFWGGLAHTSPILLMSLSHPPSQSKKLTRPLVFLKASIPRSCLRLLPGVPQMTPKQPNVVDLTGYVLKRIRYAWI